MKYSGMAFQIGITIFIGALIGKGIDGYLNTEKPYFAALFAVLFTIAALYLIFKDLQKDSNK